MSQFSSFRVGNFVTCFKAANSPEMSRIVKMDGEEFMVLFKSGEIHQCGTIQYPQSFPYIAEITLNPLAIGFSRKGDNEYSNGIIDLIDIAELEYDGQTEEDGPVHYINRLSKIGYSVRSVKDQGILFQEEWNDYEEKYVGIYGLHELQNLISDLLPDQSSELIEAPF